MLVDDLAGRLVGHGVDVAFVRGIDHDPARRAVARAVIGFATEVGASLVAEGIETPAELEQLRRLGARYGQGFHLARSAEAHHLLSGSLPANAFASTGAAR